MEGIEHLSGQRTDLTSSLHSRGSPEPETDFSYSKNELFQIGITAIGVLGLVGLRTSVKSEWVKPVTSLAGGLLCQHFFQSALPRKYVVIEQTFIADYAAPIFLSLTWVYGNVQLNAVGKEILFGTMGGLFGSTVAAAAHAYFTRNLTNQDGYAPLEDGLINDRTQMKTLFLNSKTTRIAHGMLEILAGIGMTLAGTQISKAKFLTGFGVYIGADGLSQLVSESAYQWAKKKNEVYQKQPLNLIAEPEFPAGLGRYKTCVEGLLPVAHLLPGILFTGSILAKHTSEPLSWACYAAAGLLTGFTRHTERTRFTEVPKENLDELNQKPETLNTFEKIFWGGKWIYGVAGVGSLIGLGIAGLNFETGQFETVSVIDRASLGAFGGCLYGSYAIARLAKYTFEKMEGKSRFWNWLYFYTHYSQGIPAWNLYVMSQMKIGNLALAQDSLLDQAIAATAYASLGMGLGLEAAGRGNFVKPRVLTALSASLMGNFYVWWLAGETV